MPGRVFRRRLPKPTDSGDEKVLASIEEFGFHAMHVRPWHHPEHADANAKLGPHPIYDVGVSYTVGLPYSHDHAELVVVGGLPDERAHDILWEVVHLIERGEAFTAGDQSDLVLRDLPARFGPVAKHWRKDILTYADWAARRRQFEALQILLPDGQGRFPTDGDYTGPPQPLLE